MSKPPMKSFEQLKAYCERTQCLRCVFWYTDNGFVGCRLMDNAPCDWSCEWEGEEDSHE